MRKPLSFPKLACWIIPLRPDLFPAPIAMRHFWTRFLSTCNSALIMVRRSQRPQFGPSMQEAWTHAPSVQYLVSWNESKTLRFFPMSSVQLVALLSTSQILRFHLAYAQRIDSHHTGPKGLLVSDFLETKKTQLASGRVQGQLCNHDLFNRVQHFE